MKYCPHCGTPRLGRFCTGCGTDLDSLIKSLTENLELPAEGTANASPERAARAAPEAPIESADIPADSGPDRKSQASKPDKSTPPGLSYPAPFNLQTDCLNCGTTLTQAQCDLCSD